MGTVYARGRKLWIGFKDITGRWRYEATTHVVGEEAKAWEVVHAIEARIAAGLAHGEAKRGRSRSGVTERHGWPSAGSAGSRM